MSDNIKSKRLGADQGTNYVGRIKVKNEDWVDGTESTYIEKDEVVTIKSCSADGSYLLVVPARDGVTSEVQLAVAAYQIREFGAIVGWSIVTFVTTGDTIGDPVYLSDATPGAYTTTAPAGSPIAVGKVLIVGAAGIGKILLRPLV